MTLLWHLWRFLRGKNLVHCWADGPDNSTCLRLDGHWGRCEFTPDSEFIISFEEGDA